MMANVRKIVNEARRGCGFRRKGGLYLMSGGLANPCGKLPHVLSVCPTCSNGIKFSRGWTWINPYHLLSAAECGGTYCSNCPMGSAIPTKAGLLWVGRKFYSIDAFVDEAMRLGVSRRINSIPRGFDLEMWVYLAHLGAVRGDDGMMHPGIFTAFKPHRIEYVITGQETEEELDKMEKRGLTLVDVIRTNTKEDRDFLSISLALEN